MGEITSFSVLSFRREDQLRSCALSTSDWFLFALLTRKAFIVTCRDAQRVIRGPAVASWPARKKRTETKKRVTKVKISQKFNQSFLQIGFFPNQYHPCGAHCACRMSIYAFLSREILANLESTGGRKNDG